MRKYIFLAIGMMAAMLNTSCKQDDLGSSAKSKCIVASMLPAEAARTAVGSAVDGSNAVGIVWSEGDQIGVFDSENGTQKCYAKVGPGEAPTASFAASGTAAFDAPMFAYYPYSSDNEGADISALKGVLPAIQNMAGTTLQGDYKYGRVKEATAEGHEFVFAHMFSLARVVVDAANTPMAGDELKGVKVSVLRDGTPIAIAGNFEFNARTGTWAMTGDGATAITLACNETIVLDEVVESYMSIFPNAKKGDVFSFEVTSANYTATFTAASLVNFSREQIYNFPVALNNFKSIKIYNSNGELVQDGPNNGGGGDTPDPDPTPEPEPLPEPIIGAFTCATYNVDGLPKKISVVTINGDGPGADGTSNISAKIATQNWDFVGFSEDFEYHSNLTSSLGSYQWGKHRGSISSSALYKTLDTDGLEFAARKATCSWSAENITAFTSSAGGLTSGANTCIEKGIRHYPVTIAEGVVVDVIITHMNTYSSSGSSHINAQHAQLKQIAQYINNLVANNNRPVIFMGDTNCRYTRNDFNTNFWSVLSSDLTYADPWVDFQWNGVYPTYPSNSLMVSDATGTSDTDIICADTQQGEVVDKIIYINKPGAPLQIKAKSYLRDYDNFNGLADHMPIVVEFEYTYTPQQ